MSRRKRPKPNVTFHYDGDIEEWKEYAYRILIQSVVERIMKSIAEDMKAGLYSDKSGGK